MMVMITRHIKNSQKLLLLISSLLTLAPILVISLSSLSFLVQINTIVEADAAPITNNLVVNEAVNEAISGVDIVNDPKLGLNLVQGGGADAIVAAGDGKPPTFNPMFSKCDQAKELPGEEKKLYKWEAAKYATTAKLGDKDKLKSKDFSFEVFADIVKDDASFDSDDYPYKADFKTKNDGQTSVNIKEFATVCIDLVDLELPQATQVNLDKSEALKELGFDS
jgi:hypothetical protein